MSEQTTNAVAGAETPDAFVADRQRFWDGFTRFTLGAVIAIAILLILLYLFLVR